LELSLYQYFLVAVAAVAAGAVNALAGGGTLITFPMLTAVGLPAVAANITNTIALCPGFLGGALAQREDLRGQKRRMLLFLPGVALGGIVGGLLLLNTGERLFRDLVPWLILLASALLAVGEPLRAWLNKRAGHGGFSAKAGSWAALPVAIGGIYGGYFGAGLSVIFLAVLGLLVDDSLTRINALKQTLSLTVNVAAAVFFVFSGYVVWPVAAVMAVSALLGGVVGGRLAGRIRPSDLRWTIVAIGVVISIVYFIR